MAAGLHCRGRVNRPLAPNPSPGPRTACLPSGEVLTQTGLPPQLNARWQHPTWLMRCTGFGNELGGSSAFMSFEPSKNGSKLVMNPIFGVDASAMAAGKENLALSARSKCA